MPRRTLVVTNDFPPKTGGIESFVFAMLTRLPAQDLVVLTSRQPGDSDFDAGLAFPVVRYPTRMLLPTPAVTAEAVRLARAHQASRVWFGAAAPLALMTPALRQAGITRAVATTHGHEVWWATLPGSRALLRRIGDAVDVLTYLGEYTRRRIARALRPAAAARMVRLTPGVDERVFAPGCGGEQIRRERGLGRRPVVVCVSRLVPRKGQDTLIRAWPTVRRAVPDAVLMLVGAGTPRARERLTQLAARTGVADSVLLVGEVPWGGLPPYLDAGDVFAMPARDRWGGLEVEGLGIVYLEASATGLPVIAGRSGGAPDAVLDGQTGYVVDGRRVDEVAERIIQLLTDRQLAARMGACGRAWVEQAWRWDDLAARLAQLLAG
jgi:phosphatidylinositol alpha-1,6-mannosyltransferase